MGFVQMDVSLNPAVKDVRVLTFEDRHDCMKCLTVMRQWPQLAGSQLTMGAMPSRVVEEQVRWGGQRAHSLQLAKARGMGAWDHVLVCVGRATAPFSCRFALFGGCVCTLVCERLDSGPALLSTLHHWELFSVQLLLYPTVKHRLAAWSLQHGYDMHTLFIGCLFMMVMVSVLLPLPVCSCRLPQECLHAAAVSSGW